MDTTTIRIDKKTKERLDKHGTYKATYGDIINRALDALEGKTKK
jgi:hypothetical protein